MNDPRSRIADARAHEGTRAEITDPAEIARLRAEFIAAEKAEHARKNPTGDLSEVARGRRNEWKSPSAVDHLQAGGTGMVYAMWALLGLLSGHRFYLGAHASALLQAALFVGGAVSLWQGGVDDLLLISAGFIMLLGFGLWYLADLLFIPGLVRKQEAGEDMGSVFF